MSIWVRHFKLFIAVYNINEGNVLNKAKGKETMSEEDKKMIIVIIIMFLIIGALGSIKSCNDKTGEVVNTGIDQYEEFHSIYNTTLKLKEDIKTINGLDENDKMFNLVSKSATLMGKKQLLNRWVSEYNAKSSMVNREVWKGTSLPYKLEIDN